MRMNSLAAAAGMALAVLSQGTAAQAAEIKIIAGAVMAPVFEELGPQFERATGHKLVIKYGVTGEMKRQIEGGEALDLPIVGSPLLDDLIKQGKIAAIRGPYSPASEWPWGYAQAAPSPTLSSVDAFSAHWSARSRLPMRPKA